MQRPGPNSEPIFNAPGVVVGLLGLFAGVHLLRVYGPAAEVEWWTLALAFVPARLGGGAALPADFPGGGIAVLTSFLTHTVVHGDVVHLLLNSAWLLAFASAVARRIGLWRFLALYAATAVAGALLFYAVNGPVVALLIGASGAISGLVGAAFRFFFRALDAARYDPDGLAGAAATVPRMSLAEMARDRRARGAIVAWLVLNLAVALALPLLGATGAIAWEAHLGGFLLGLLAFGWFDRVLPPRSPLDDAAVQNHTLH